MTSHELVSYRNPLDLLHRFSPTPLKTQVHLECATLFVETNDFSFLALLPSAASPNFAQGSHACRWKLVRDVDVHAKLAEASIVMTGGLTVYSMGPACIIGADRECKEIIAFVGHEVDAHLFQEFVLPALCRLTEFVVRAEETAASGRTAEVVIGDYCDA